MSKAKFTHSGSFTSTTFLQALSGLFSAKFLVDPGHATKLILTGIGSAFIELTSFGFLLASNRLMLLQAGVLPQSLQSLDGIPNAFHYGLMALALERIPNCMSTSHCVMTTLHLGTDD